MPEPDPLRPWEIDKERFRNHMEWISGVFNVIPLSDAVENLKNGTLKRGSLAITFDDGYLDNATEALPILKEFGFHATFFCTSAWLDGGLMWNDQVIESIRLWPEKRLSIDHLGINSLSVETLEEKNKAIEKILPKLKYLEHSMRQELAMSLISRFDDVPELMMDRKHLKLLQEQGMEIGGHTHSHPILSQLDDTSLELELAINKKTLESAIESPIKLFAFPNGKPGLDFDDKQIPSIRNAGYLASLTTAPGTASSATNLFKLPRFTPWDKHRSKFLARMITYSR